MAKAKEYSKKQREIVASKGQRKVGRVEVLSESAVSCNNNENQDPAGIHTNFHS